jgi:hypothetical protein
MRAGRPRPRDTDPGAGLAIVQAWNAELEAAVAYVSRIWDTPLIPTSHIRYTFDYYGRGDKREWLPNDGRYGRKYEVDVKGSIATAAGVIVSGAELGFWPQQALRAIYVVNGQTALYASAMLALCQEQGHRFETAESTSARCVMRARRADEEAWQEFSWDTDRATTYGLLPGRANTQWQKNPKGMLRARTTSEACRAIGADALLGMAYSVEELTDEQGANGEVLAIMPPAPADGGAEPAEPEGKRKARRRNVATAPTLPRTPKTTGSTSAHPPDAPHREPSTDPGAEARDDEATAKANATPAERRLSNEQRNMVLGRLRNLGITAKPAVLGRLGQAVGRTITSTSQLTPDDMPKITAYLDEAEATATADAEGADPDADIPEE